MKNIFTETELAEIEILCESIFKLINGYIKYLDKQKQNRDGENSLSQSRNPNS